MTNEHISPVSVNSVAMLGSYVPRQCGIATFTKDLRDALAGHIGDGAAVVAMDDGHERYAYPREVHYQISQQRIGEYVTAAEMLNNRQVDAVCVQHEYGIFGGRDGSHVVNFARRLNMPLIATLHTVLTEPSLGQRQTLKDLIRLCDRVVVMSRRAEDILENVWAVPRRKIAFIPHGIPDVPFMDPHYFSGQFDTVGRRVLLTFGLLGPGKGIETAIKALPRIVERHPDVLYIILGATHPHVLRNEGNRYRETLEAMINELGLQNHVRFDNRYVSTPELMQYLGVTDLYVIPYPNAAQITSGTLAYAVGAGKAVVSTPFWHAEELLADGRGRLFGFNDSDELARQVNDLLDNPNLRHAMRREAYDFARPMVWQDVAKRYLDIIGEAIEERRNGQSTVALLRGDAPERGSTVKVDFAHVRRLSDGTGIMQHAVGSTPDRRHGYCTDDNARSLIAALMQARQTGDQTALDLADRYVSFLHYAFNDKTGRFRNFMDYGRLWLEEHGSEDSHGRAVWSLGAAVHWSLTDSMRAVAFKLLQAATPITLTFRAPRAMAFAVIGLYHHLQHYTGDTQARRALEVLADRLYTQFAHYATDEWPWLEETVTYDNAKLPHALLLAGKALDRPEMTQQGLRSLDWLVKLQVDDAGVVSLIGNDGWLHRDGRRARFDQQPVEAMALVEACVEAGRLTGDSTWLDHGRVCLGWFTGANELGVSLVDAATGGCCDGLHTSGLNINQGAESTLAWVIAGLTIAGLDDDTATIEDIADATRLSEASRPNRNAPV